ncbi:hypothetical protein [Methylophilus aquaticus]|uniref:Uncharacterized protein n=1 Tax=Methylophilus aquaticus TaxID=1971610 RepID=A0ABT9JR69_9PROT|nr:hypothetical protein [Methylophilus aquaticus]MDP8567060.1 hypothetical protein [Methylophilus aquaticus]
MDNTDIPVLTKKVSKNNVPAAVDMAELVAQVKQALLPELSAALRNELAEHMQHEVSAHMQSQVQSQEQSLQQPLEAMLTRHAEAEQRTFTDYAQLIQQSLITEARAQIGDSIQSIEQAFREAMTNVGKQQVQAVEETLSGLLAVQHESFAEKRQQLSEELQQSLEVYVKQLQDESQHKLATEHEVVESNLTLEYRQSLEKAFSEFAAKQTAEFKYQFTADLPAVEKALEDKINALVATHMEEIKAQLTAQLKSKILEVLQGIKFVMPTV